MSGAEGGIQIHELPFAECAKSCSIFSSPSKQRPDSQNDDDLVKKAKSCSIFPSPSEQRPDSQNDNDLAKNAKSCHFGAEGGI